MELTIKTKHGKVGEKILDTYSSVARNRLAAANWKLDTAMKTFEFDFKDDLLKISNSDSAGVINTTGNIDFSRRFGVSQLISMRYNNRRA